MASALLVASLVAGCATPAFNAAGPGATRQTTIGKVLVDADGRTLYIYGKDEPGASHCTGLCAMAWPPAGAGKAAEPHDGFTLVARPDGSRQWAWQGFPLYGYIGDNAAGDVTGEGVDGLWHAARP